MPLCLGVAIEPILINYPTRRTAQRVYLPSAESPSFGLPEVIDNRARIPVSSTDIATALTARPALGLQTPFANNAADFYPVYAFTRGSGEPRQKNVATDNNNNNEVFGDLLPGQLKINEMSCQNSAEELYFRYIITTNNILRKMNPRNKPNQLASSRVKICIESSRRSIRSYYTHSRDRHTPHYPIYCITYYIYSGAEPHYLRQRTTRTIR